MTTRVVDAGSDITTSWLGLTYPEARAFNETYGFSGSHGMVHVEALLIRPSTPSRTLFIFMHPTTSMDALPVPRDLAALGCHVLCARNRYYRNDSAMIFEKVLLDYGAWVRHAKTELGYDKVVLVGWSGGGPLTVFYQSQAENPTIVDTPHGDPVDLVNARLIPGDAVVYQAGSVSRARILLEALDPSVTDELDPGNRDTRLDLYGPDAPQPPFAADFLAEYRSAQLARMRRITAWVKDRLVDLDERGGKEMEQGFVVHRTMADPRYIDPAVDANDRQPRSFLNSDPETVNVGPTGFARFSTLRSWLSQWSIDDSRADAVDAVRNISVPFLAIENTADDGAPRSHMQEVFAACGSPDTEYVEVKGANHYYAGQPEELRQTSLATRDFLLARSILDIEQD